MATLLGLMYRYHAEFVVAVVDGVLESVCLGLEQNDLELEQRREAEVEYLGELYNYRMIEHPVIFDTMYRILNFPLGEATFWGTRCRRNGD